MNKDQSLTWELLIILGVILVLVSPIGDWLAGLVAEIAIHHDVNLQFNPAGGRAGSGIFNTTMMGGGSGGGGGSEGGTSLFNVPIIDSHGEAGTIQVVAHNPESAIGNAHQGGNTPTGPAVSV